MSAFVVVETALLFVISPLSLFVSPSAEARMSSNAMPMLSPLSAPTRNEAFEEALVLIVGPLNAAAMVAPVTFPAFASCVTSIVTPRRSKAIDCSAFAPIALTATVCEMM